MKPKHFPVLMLLFLFSPALLLSQNIGIGTPAPAMKLQISSNTDTNLLMLENTNILGVNTNSGMYFKNGVYYTGAVKAIGTGAVFARMGFFTFATADPNGLQERMSITDDGNVGIGILVPDAKLDINGLIKIRGGIPGAGKVLSSDVNGLATWQMPAELGSAFKATIGSGGFNVSSSANTPIIFTGEDYDDPSAFFSTEFFAPATGLYHFDALITWDITGVAFNTQYVIAATVDGSDKHADVLQVPGGSGSRYRTQSLSFDLKLTSGQRVGLYANQDSGIIQTILGNSGAVRYSFFSGRRVY
ncbi:MAG: hypothetical protein NTW29_06105 [Bacteroidetes bacterium]|nr:hypothetical protein [Bacteroidota bacterium]